MDFDAEDEEDKGDDMDTEGEEELRPRGLRWTLSPDESASYKCSFCLEGSSSHSPLCLVSCWLDAQTFAVSSLLFFFPLRFVGRARKAKPNQKKT